MTPTVPSKRRKVVVLSAIALIGLIIVAALGVAWFQKSVVRTRETVLANNLHVLRQTIDQYAHDNKKAPKTLRDLVSQGYLRAVPIDPITGNDQWRIVMEDAQASVNPAEPGIVDVRSTSDGRSLKGDSYSAW
jgi:general secretion pathway protein G